MGILADKLGAATVLVGGLGVDTRTTPRPPTSTVAGSSIVAATVTGVERVAVQGLSDSLMSLAGAGGGAVAGLLLAAAGYSGLSMAGGVLAVVGVGAFWLLSRMQIPAQVK